jgi:spore germination cell wall hydrolase CwlJ-like protein
MDIGTLTFAAVATMLVNNMTEQQVKDPQVQCLAQNIYYEAKAESFKGKIAVAEVTINRARDWRYPNTVCKVVLQVLPNGTRMFSWTGRYGQPIKYEPQAWIDSFVIAAVMYHHSDKFDPITNGATHFHNTSLGNLWPQYTHTVTIGQHRCYRH